jgi:hypothetical protein
MQSWRISRFNGQLNTLELSVARAGAALACVYGSSEKPEATVIRARHAAGLLDSRYLIQMRVILCTTAISALAVLLLILL